MDEGIDRSSGAGVVSNRSNNENKSLIELYLRPKIRIGIEKRRGRHLGEKSNRTVDLRLGRHLFPNTVPQDSRDRSYPSEQGRRCLLPVNLPFFLIFFTGTMDAPAEGRYRHS